MFGLGKWRRSAAQLCQQFGLMLVHQRIDEQVQITAKELIEFVEGQIDAVVGDSALGEIIGPDTLGAITTSDLEAAGFGNFGVLPRLFLLHEA